MRTYNEALDEFLDINKPNRYNDSGCLFSISCTLFSSIYKKDINVVADEMHAILAAEEKADKAKQKETGSLTKNDN
jgi:hypothetical protein